LVDGLTPGGSTNLHDSLKLAFEKALQGLETSSRRVIFLTDGIATAGLTDSETILAMARGYVRRYVQLTTIGLGHDVNLPLLRALAEEGSGNFYFLEEPAAAREVFTRELRFFVAPIAYDVEVSFTAGSAYDVASLSGSSLWQPITDGGRIQRPSVYLASRTDDEPRPRRWAPVAAGAALLGELRVAGDDSPGQPRRHCQPAAPGAGEQHLRERERAGDLRRPSGRVCGEEGSPRTRPSPRTPSSSASTPRFHEATVLARTDRDGARAMLEALPGSDRGNASPAAPTTICRTIWCSSRASSPVLGSAR
jgi:hypothetical protein